MAHAWSCITSVSATTPSLPVAAARLRRRVSDALRPGRVVRDVASRPARRGAPQVRAAGAFTKLIEIPVARGVAKASMVPARRFMDGASAGEDVLSSVLVRVEHADVSVPPDAAPLLPLSGYDVGEVPFVMQAVCYYRETLDVGLPRERAAPDPRALSHPRRTPRPLRPGPAAKGHPSHQRRRPVSRRRGPHALRPAAPGLRRRVPQISRLRTMDRYHARWRSRVHREGDATLGRGFRVGRVCMSHAVSDGQGFVEFLVAWAERAAGRDHPIGDPVFDRSLLPAPPPEMDRDELRTMLAGEGFDATDPTMMLGRAVVAGRVLVPDFLRFPPGNRMMVPVPKANLDAIRAAAGDGVSQNEALSAHVWLQLSRLMGLPEGSPLEHVTVVSGRGVNEGCQTCTSATPPSGYARDACRWASTTTSKTFATPSDLG